MTGTAVACGGALFHSEAYILSRTKQCRSQTAEQRGQQRRSYGEIRDAAFDADALQPRGVRWEQGKEAVSCPQGNQKSASATDQRDEEAFDELLTQQRPA